jgi:splicing factor 3A subunit 1
MADAEAGATAGGDAIVQGKVTGLIYPPPDIRAIVDKTAQFVASNGRAFESRIIGERMSAKFSFLRDADPYHAYYEHKVSEFAEKRAADKAETDAQQPKEEEQPVAAEGDEAARPKEEAPPDEQAAAAKAAADAGAVVVEKQPVQDVTAKVAKKIKEKALEPPDEEVFSIKHPPQLSALDQEVMYLTAQYTAVSGKPFLSGLATREQRNPQFDFLKPTHPLFTYFTALVESYAQVTAKSDKQMKRCV